MARNVAVLIGNGLSVAFNAELNLQQITQEVLERIRRLDGDDVVTAMKELAARALPDGANTDEDFEVLVGALGAESRTLEVLNRLAQLTNPKDEELRDCIRKVASFAEQVCDSGISHVLQVITERSHAYQDTAQNLNSLVASLTDAFDGKVVLANLNYDTLLLSALLNVCQSDLADMGHGRKQASVILDDNQTREVQQLRAFADDFPQEKRVQLLHLHGSLTFWATRDRTTFVKIPKNLLEDGEQWHAVRNRTTNIRPAVVLANRKDKVEHVTRQPFALAYNMYTVGLKGAKHWLIVGYSFRDDPVNERLRTEFLDRTTKPKVLVVTYGADPERRTVERAFGWGVEDGPSDWLTINRGGANGAEKTQEWGSFIETSKQGLPRLGAES
ncbi:hypothetical protein C5E06_07110 [Pseudoclavibacter sp. RFBI5]|uniref:SIR2 family protein n=1 Tax=Pseudoclavibacter sp. RFBI5 TaxID=2080578 RepID=UPI000CE8B23D|nr:SIR2 family protein [Pseudoclavibacter sp. RFBI5]PPG02261.1 hypothetical protein C5E06_07110 [Pseudoclavibacter sp. RFBI5]